MDGHDFYKPNSFKLDNIIKLRLACDTGAADPVAGILGKSCFVGTKHVCASTRSYDTYL